MIVHFNSYSGHLENMVSLIDSCENGLNENRTQQQLLQMMW
jgi:hypothetical protein